MVSTGISEFLLFKFSLRVKCHGQKLELLNYSRPPRSTGTACYQYYDGLLYLQGVIIGRYY